MTLGDFIAKYNNQGIDFDGAYGYQCMDLAEQYNHEVVGGPRIGGNAVDVWSHFPDSCYEQIANQPDNAPSPGDIIIWGTAVGQFGHIAVVIHADSNSFTSFDQNWPTGSLCHVQSHSYNGVLGWLHPKPAVIAQPIPQPETPAMNDQTIIPAALNGTGQDLEIQAIRGKLGDLVRIQNVADGDLEMIQSLNANIYQLKSQLADALSTNTAQANTIAELRQQITDLQAQLAKASTSPKLPPKTAAPLSNRQLVTELLRRLTGR